MLSKTLEVTRTNVIKHFMNWLKIQNTLAASYVFNQLTRVIYKIKEIDKYVEKFERNSASLPLVSQLPKLIWIFLTFSSSSIFTFLTIPFLYFYCITLIVLRLDSFFMALIRCVTEILFHIEWSWLASRYPLNASTV